MRFPRRIEPERWLSLAAARRRCVRQQRSPVGSGADAHGTALIVAPTNVPPRVLGSDGQEHLE